MIWHLLPLPKWRTAMESGRLPGPAEPGSFLHASPDEATALAVANAYFLECAEPVVALGIDVGRISAEVRVEPPDPEPVPGVDAGTRFPHVYGPVEADAVGVVRYARRDPAGRYIAFEARPPTADALDLLPHPEGGWFRQTWQAGPAFAPAGYPGERAAATAIYFLLPPGAESVWHRVRSDELWLWHGGGPLDLLLGGDGGRPEGGQAPVVLGPDLGGGQRPQQVVPGRCWQSARPSGEREVLVSCIVAPGFDFADFEVIASA
jgi:predicted cupin superfamily sugar epimerase/uncharacterized protein (DUF952 family)